MKKLTATDTAHVRNNFRSKLKNVCQYLNIPVTQELLHWDFWKASTGKVKTEFCLSYHGHEGEMLRKVISEHIRVVEQSRIDGDNNKNNKQNTEQLWSTSSLSKSSSVH